MDVIFSFDTEDFVTPEAADAQKWWAEALTRRSLRGSFQCVAQVLRRLKARGRLDVIDALAKHEIGYHTQFHSVHPLHPPAVENLSLEEGIAWVLKREAAGLAEVIETFGRMPVSYCPPGVSWTPATLLAMAACGIRVFTGNGFPRPHWYCGLLGVRYDLAFESYFEGEGNREDDFHRDFEVLARSAGGNGTIVLYSHPTRLVTTRFWDEPLYRGRELAPDAIPPAPLRSAEAVARNQALVERLLDWVADYPSVQFTDHAGLYAQFAGSRRDLPALLQETGLKPGEEGRLPLHDDPALSDEMRGFFDRFSYGWPVYPRDFKGTNLKQQMRQLAWTLRSASL